MFTINQGPKKVSATYTDRHYAIGFTSPTMARHVQYNLFHNIDRVVDPVVYITKRNEETILLDMEFTDDIKRHPLTIYTGVDLYMQKKKPTRDSILDSPYHIDVIPVEDFYAYPIDKLIGIVIPDEIIEEDESLIIFSATMIDPYYDPEYYKRQLDKHFP